MPPKRSRSRSRSRSRTRERAPFAKEVSYQGETMTIAINWDAIPDLDREDASIFAELGYGSWYKYKPIMKEWMTRDEYRSNKKEEDFKIELAKRAKGFIMSGNGQNIEFVKRVTKPKEGIDADIVIETREGNDRDTERINMLEWFTHLNKTQRRNLLSFIREPNNISPNDDDLCAICLDDFSEEGHKRLNCTHLFHKKCIEDYWKTLGGAQKCPACRANAQQKSRKFKSRSL